MSRGPRPAGAVLFDLDGVIADSRVPFARCVNSALAEQGLQPLPARELYRYLGPPLHSTFHALVSDPALVQPCVDCYRARYRATAAAETTVFTGMRELLAELAARLPLIVATSKPRALAEPMRSPTRRQRSRRCLRARAERHSSAQPSDARSACSSATTSPCRRTLAS